jgi:hypothetical protein
VPLPPDVPVDGAVAEAAVGLSDVLGPVGDVAGAGFPELPVSAGPDAGSVAVEAPPVAAAGPSPPAAAGAFGRLASRASFLAQPEPLNTMAGTESARFMVPPHRSQVVGPAAAIEWITSTTWPHDSHA